MTSEPGTSGRTTARVLALLAVLTSLYFADVLFLGKRLFIRDVASYYYPTKKLLREAWLAGGIPLWNHAYGAGQPMAANPEYAAFYPPHLLLLLPDYDFAFQLLVVLHVFVAAWGAYRCLRSMGLRESSSVYGAITFAFGGLFASLLNLLPYLFLLTWLPWAFLHVRRWLTSGGWGDMALAGLFLGLQILTAEPTTLVQVWLLIGIYALYRVVRAERHGSAFGRIAPRVGLLLLVALAVGAIQLLPAIDHVGDSVRAEPFAYKTVSSWSMPPIRPVEIALPAAFGRVWREGDTAYLGAVLYGIRPLPFLFSFYMGMLGCCLAIAGVRARLPGTGLFLIVMAVSLLLALGDNTPLLRWLYDAGFAASFRYAEKFAIMGLVALAVYQARVFDALADDPQRLGRTAAIAAGIVMLVALAGAALFFSGGAGAVAKWLTGVAGPAALAAIVRDARIDWIANAARAAVALALFVAAARGGVGRRWMATAIAATFVDLAIAGRAVSPSIDARFYSEPPAASRLAPDRTAYRIFPLADWYYSLGRSTNGRRFAESGNGTYWTARNGLGPMLSATWGFRYAVEMDYDRTALLPTKHFIEAVWKIRNELGEERDETLMAMAGARYRTRFRDYATATAGGARVELLEPVSFEELGKGERYYFAKRLLPARSAAEFANALVAGDPGPRAAFVANMVGEVSPGTVLSWRETPRSIEVECEADGRSLLVLSVTPHRYWQATVEGRRAELLPVNLGFSGVALPRGRHRVLLEYRNPVVIAGAEITLVAILALGTIVVVSRRRAKSMQ
ncbi:MAG: YfhO family protein [Thermoanaerobaculia bacterium]|nr:YfhO family protein [Thermoanaerobaculia bacterium]